MENILKYYKTPGIVTDLKKYSDFINWLTNDIRAIYQGNTCKKFDKNYQRGVVGAVEIN